MYMKKKKKNSSPKVINSNLAQQPYETDPWKNITNFDSVVDPLLFYLSYFSWPKEKRRVLL